MLESKRFRSLRIWVIVLLAVLAVQYELGMAVNIANPPHLAPIGLSFGQFNSALMQAGLPAELHAGWGSLLGLIAIVNLVLALRTGMRSVQVFGTLTFLAVLVAGILGQLFVQSGFQNDGYSHGMATFFILSVIFCFRELYFLKPSSLPHTG